MKKDKKTHMITDDFGYCSYNFEPDGSVVIFNLYVRPEYRRRGVARRILECAISEIRRSGYEGAIGIGAIPREDSISVDDLISFYKSLRLKILETSTTAFETWRDRAIKAEAKLTEAKKNIEFLYTSGEIMQKAIWPHDELEIQLNPGTHSAPQIVKDWREFVAKHLK